MIEQILNSRLLLFALHLDPMSVFPEPLSSEEEKKAIEKIQSDSIITQEIEKREKMSKVQSTNILSKVKFMFSNRKIKENNRSCKRT